MTVAVLGINGRKNRICRSRMLNYKNLHIVVSELTKFLVRKAKLITQFGKFIEKHAAAKAYFFEKDCVNVWNKKKQGLGVAERLFAVLYSKN